MYEYYPVNGEVTQLSKDDASKKMDEIVDQWEDESTSFGTLYMGVYDWAFDESGSSLEIKLPELANGGSIPKNDVASAKFGFDIYGDCFLKLS